MVVRCRYRRRNHGAAAFGGSDVPRTVLSPTFISGAVIRDLVSGIHLDQYSGEVGAFASVMGVRAAVVDDTACDDQQDELLLVILRCLFVCGHISD